MPDPEPVRLVLDRGRRYRLQVLDLGLACCAVEFVAAAVRAAPGALAGVVPLADGPRTADVLVVSGTVTDALAPAVRRLYEQMPEPRYVLSMGSCSNSGGPYWDSYCVVKGVDQVVPVDVWVPGCPPRPEAVLEGLLQLQEQVAAGAPSSAAAMGASGGVEGGAPSSGAPLGAGRSPSSSAPVRPPGGVAGPQDLRP